MTLIEEARGLIKAHIAGRQNFSIAALARLCGMPPTTARSIIQGDVKSPSVENITSLLLTFMSIDDVADLLRRHSDEKFWKGILGSFKEPSVSENKEANGTLAGKGFRWEHPDQLILAMACLPNGVDPNWIVKKFGEVSAWPRIQALLDEGLIREINGRFKIHGDFVYFPMIADSQKKAALHAQNWQANEIEQGGWVYHITQNYRAQDHEQAKEYARDFLDKLSALGKNNDGDKVLVFSMNASLLDGGV